MCRSKAEGGRRCPAGPAHDGGRRAQDSGQARTQGSPAGMLTAGQRLAAEICAVSQDLGLAAGGGDAQYALEHAAARIRRIYVATASQAGGLDDGAMSLREAALSLASRIDSGLDNELTSRREMLRWAAGEAGNVARLARPDEGSAPAPAAVGRVSADELGYLDRVARLDQQIAAGESITDIMKREQLERGEARISEIMANG